MAVHAYVPGFIANILIIMAPLICIIGIILLFREWGHGSALYFLRTWRHEAFRDGISSFFVTLLMDVLLLRRVWRRSKYRWAGHMIIFWTFLVLAVFTIISLAGFIAVLVDPNGWGASFNQALNTFHLPYDLLSYVLLAAGLFALFRRLLLTKVRERTLKTDYFIILSVIIIAITGIVAEVYSGFATFFGKTMLDFALAIKILQLHLFAVFLLFIILIPWTRFRHIITTPILILARRGGE
jgi:heterodisulfide reductase subunit E